MLRRVPAVLLAIFLAAPLFGVTRMTYDINGTPTAIEWAPTAFPLRYEIDRRLAQTYPIAQQLIDRAFAAWAAVPDANIRFESKGIVNEVGSNTPDRIAITLASDLFANQGAAAVTSYSYDVKTGRMLDADIAVDPSLFTGELNAQAALQHEIGHVLGLDHSAVLSSIMYPYVGASDDTPAALDLDDRIGIATMYPKGDPLLAGATLSGRVTGDQGGIFAAQVVAVNDQGQPAGTALTNAAGEFTIEGLPSGRYRLYVEPLDGPVDPNALQGTWRLAKVTSFPTEFFSTPIDVQSGRVYGNLMVTAAGASQLNPRWIGVSDPGAPDMSLSTAPATVRPGQTVTITVAGDGFTSGMTNFEVLNPAFRRISDFGWMQNCVHATYVVEADAPSSSAVVVVKSGNETATLTGALKIYRTPRRRAIG